MITNEKKHVVVKKAFLLIILMTTMVLLSGCTTQSTLPLSELLVDRGYASTETGWTSVLTPDQKALLDAAFESSLESGYKGAKGEWLTNEVRYRMDGDEVTIVLPDGKEFHIEQDDFFAADASDAITNSVPVAASQGAAGMTSDVEEWEGALDEEQRVMLDIAYESSVASGYMGTRDEWLVNAVTANYDHNGDVVVALPDGAELTVRIAKKTSAEGGGNDSGQDAAGEDENNEDRDAEERSNAPSRDTALKVERKMAHPGDVDVAVQVQIEGNPGVLGLMLSVSYDESALTLRGAENGEVFRDVLTMTHSKDYGSGCLFSWDGVEVKEGDVRDGTALTLYFDVSEGAKLGKYPVAVRVGSAVNNDLQQLEMAVRDGNVTVR